MVLPGHKGNLIFRSVLCFAMMLWVLALERLPSMRDFESIIDSLILSLGSHAPNIENVQLLIGFLPLVYWISRDILYLILLLVLFPLRTASLYKSQVSLFEESEAYLIWNSQ